MIEYLPIDGITERIIDYRGKTPPKTDDGIRLITAKVIKGGTILDTKAEYIASDFYEEWMRRGIPRKKDILLTTEAPLGEVAQIRTDSKIALAQRVILLRGNPKHIDQQYYFQAMKSPFVQAELLKRATGTTVLGIKQAELRKVLIPVPPFQTQRKIASILSTYDDLIENNTRRIAILEEMAQRIYREWFVHFRYPSHEQDELVESELGLIPEGWEVKKLGDVLVFAYGKGLTKDNRKIGKIPVYGSGGIVGSHNTSLVKGPGIIVGRKGNVGSIFWSAHDFYPIDTVFYIESNLSLHFVYYNLQHQNFHNTDAAVPGLSRNDAYLNKMIIPHGDVLDRFEYQMTPLFQHVESLTKQNKNLRQTRDLLLPKLISGKIDVSELDIEI